MSLTETQKAPSSAIMRKARRRLGQSDLEITPVGFGAWAIGGGQWEFAWGAQDDTQSIAAIRRAIELGMNWIDTAAVYGLGHSEEVVSQALRDIPKNDRPYVFTKCSLVWNEAREVSHNLEAASIQRECEASLKRLQIDTIDLYQIHWPAWKGGPESASPGSIEEALGAMTDLRKAGKIRHIGVSNFNVPQLERGVKVAPIVSLQPPYSMLHRDAESELFPWCERQGVGTIVYSPMVSGLLAGKMTKERVAAFPDDDWRRDSPDFQEPRLSRNLALVERLRQIGARHGRPPGEVAVAWVLRLPAVTGAIVGGRSYKQVEGMIGAATFRLSREEIAEIESALTAG
ncbi:MAG TPA: aldo/keto reductase [Bryobacteraceae bacterium]|jgi:aryl-alcohol dehydrogenase-like predicted oxidoreductase|nr:aldo/keto reductase [Bryobacteraceae bacterium]